MERKDFLKGSLGFLGMALFVPSILKSGSSPAPDESSAACAVTNSETAGPFPTITPSSLVQTNIIGSRTGVPLTINITIKNTNNNCNVLQGAIVDIWHCDKDGYYSEYGGTPMQTIDYTAVHFLRGRQTTDATGLVSFSSIFPGWYTSRATHIHVHIYDASGNSLLVTQIAFPEDANSAVVQVNSATSYGYTKGMSGYTYNASDNVFSDGVTNELCSISGTVSSGFVLSHEIYVAGPSGTTGLKTNSGNNRFALGQVYPNPFTDLTTLPITLNEAADVTLEVYNLEGRKVGEVIRKGLAPGEQRIQLQGSAMFMPPGSYLLIAVIKNSTGEFKQTKLVLKQ